MATTLEKGIEALSDALEIAEGRLAADALAQANSVVERAQARLSTSAATTVAVFAGATGSGKSSLVNAVVGEEVARVAATRPTTSQALAISAQEVGELLDWLEVPNRHIAPSVPDGLVVLDLPDIDSTEEGNRRRAAQMIGKADALVWVLDPQKYADAVVHEDYLRKMSEHASVMLIVLNQIDRVAQADRAGMLRDVKALVAADGIETHVLAVSARTGEGVAELRSQLAALASKRKAAAQRLAADMRASGAALEGAVKAEGGSEPSSAKMPDFLPVARTIAGGAGGDIVVDAAEKSYIRRAKKATGWPLIRWIHRLPDPLERLHLAAPAKAKRSEEPKMIGATSLIASPTAKANAQATVRRYAENAADCLPTAWRRDVLNATTANTDALLDECDEVIARTDLGQQLKPAWWQVVNILQWLCTLAAIGGLVWLVLLHAVDWLKIELPQPPMVSIFPVPALLLLGGIVACLLLAGFSSLAARRGGARLRQKISKKLSKQIAAKAEASVLDPLTHARTQYERFWNDVRALRQVRA